MPPPDRSLVLVLVTMMLATGVANTIITKYQDMQCVRNCDDPDPKKRVTFEFPVLQTLQMFTGEMGCWLVVLLSTAITSYNRRHAPAPLLANDTPDDTDDDLDPNDPAPDDASSSSTALLPKPQHPPSHHHPDPRVPLHGARILLLALPACCDITGTTLMNVGLLFVVASIYQMTRGALVLFVGLFSVVFLRRRLFAYQWLALITVVLGVALVGLAGALSGEGTGKVPDGLEQRGLQALVRRAGDAYEAAKVPGPAALRTVVGVLFIAGAQVFTASQFVLEEWILERYAMTPLKVVGWEGVFGFVVTLAGMGVLHGLVGSTEAGRGGYFDAVEGWRAMVGHPRVMWSSLAIMLSIGGFNFFGISVTRTVSATSRSTIDTCRTLFIWVISLALGWESFKWLQVVGFAMLVYGTFLFNDIVRPPLEKYLAPSREEREQVLEQEREGLLPEEPVEHL